MNMLKVSRSLKMFVALTVAFFGVGLMSASADSFVSIVGQLGPGAGYSAFLIVDTSGGSTPATGETIVSGSVQIWGEGVGNDGTYSSTNDLLFNGEDPYNPYPSYLFAVGSYNDPYMDLYFSGDVPFSETSVCTNINPCGYDITQFRPLCFNNNNGLGANSPQVPEPSSLPLVACGMLGIGLFVRKQRLVTK
jgi:hypothetical protein